MEGFGEVGELCGGGGGEEGGCEEVAEEGEVVGRAVAGGGIVGRRHEVNVDETSAEACKRLDWTCEKYTKISSLQHASFLRLLRGDRVRQI